MATRKKDVKADETKGRQRFVDQPGQWRDITPKSVKKKQAKAWKKFEDSLTPERKKALGLTSAKKKK